MYASCAAGLLLQTYIIYKAENLWSTWIEGGPHSSRYNRSCSGWFDAVTFTDWFKFHFVSNVRHISGKKVLIEDHFSSHFSKKILKLAWENDNDFCCLPPNSTHVMQPLDVAFFAPLKRA